MQPWSAETGAARGSSRPGLREPEQWPGTHEPASCKAGPVRRRRLSSPPIVGGRDGAQAPLDVALRPTGERWAVPNEAASRATRVTQIQAVSPVRIVLEASGGYQRAVVAALAAAAWPVVVVHPRQARDFATATGP